MSFWLKFTVTVNVLLLMLKCLKFNCFMLRSQKIKCLVLSRCPHSDPHTSAVLYQLAYQANWKLSNHSVNSQYTLRVEEMKVKL